MTILSNPTLRTTRGRRARALALVGVLGTAAGLVGAAHAALVLAYPPAVSEDAYSFPFEADGFAVSQSLLAARDLALAVLLVGLLWTPVARSRVARAGLIGSVASMLALAALEIVSVAVGDSADPGAWYGFASFGVGLGLTVAGTSAARAATRSRWQRYLPLAAGLYVFVVLTPGILAGSTPGQFAIGAWMLLFARLGWTLVETSPAPPEAAEPVTGTAP